MLCHVLFSLARTHPQTSHKTVLSLVLNQVECNKQSVFTLIYVGKEFSYKQTKDNRHTMLTFVFRNGIQTMSEMFIGISSWTSEASINYLVFYSCIDISFLSISDLLLPMIYVSLKCLYKWLSFRDILCHYC